MDWVAWVREVERDRRVLESILATILALADLAEGAAGLPASHRLFAILSYGEAEARLFVIGMAHEAGAATPDIGQPRAAGHAERLAASFRLLALVLAAMLLQAGRLARLTRLAGCSPVHGGSEGQPRAARGRDDDVSVRWAATQRAPPSPTR